MLRRHFIQSVPVFALTPTAATASAPRGARPALAGRLTGLAAWSSHPDLKPRVRVAKGKHGTVLISLDIRWPSLLPAELELGVSFSGAPGFRHGVAFWRYAPWKAWTKPMKMARFDDLEVDDVQCAYWQYNDGTYAVALPLGGGGFRTTLGARGGNLATVSTARAAAKIHQTLPQLAIGFGPDLYGLMNAVFRDAMAALGTPENLRDRKTLPEALHYLGWNTWNASNNGQLLSEPWIVDQARSIIGAGAPIKTLVIDDGYFEASNGQLQSLAPNRAKFPNGLKPVVDHLKASGFQHVGVWHAFNMYWNGIDPNSELGRLYKVDMFTWTQKPSPIDTTGKMVTYAALKPDPALLDHYFDTYYTQLRGAGISLIKVDNQLVAERMATDNYPVWDLASAYHTAINHNAAKHFNNAIINCMDMTNDAFLNFGTTPVARSVEDYFPFKPTETYNLQEGNAAAHVLQAIYNALYFGQLVFPDFDMFETTNPNAGLHAVVRAANCAPIYVTDKAGQHDIDLMKSLVDAEGITLRAETPLVPCTHCLFQVQDPALFKAWSLSGQGGLLVLMNLADTPNVSGTAQISDIAALTTGRYAVWAHFAQTLCLREGTQQTFTLARMGHEILNAAPIHEGRAVLGLSNKLNGLASVRDIRSTQTQLDLTVRDGGTLIIYSDAPPHSVRVDNKPVRVVYDNKIIRIDLTDGSRSYQVTIT